MPGLALRIIEEYEEENGWYFVWCDDKPAFVFVLGYSVQLTRRKRQLHARIAAFCIDWECSCVSPSADGEELSSCCCLDALTVLCY